MEAVDYVHKPFSAPIMLARVKTHIALRAGVRTGAGFHTTMGPS